MSKHRSIFIALNLAIFVDVIVILFAVLIQVPSSFRFFTVLSNLFMAIIAISVVCLELKQRSSHALNILYLIATTSLVLVFLVVALFLAPQFQDYFYLFSEYNFFLHFLNPLFAVASLFLINNPKFNYRICFLTLIPPVLYAIFYFIFVIIKKDWPDFYNFTLGGRDWLSFVSLIIVLAVTYSVSAILVTTSNKFSKKASSIKDKNMLN